MVASSNASLNVMTLDSTSDAMQVRQPFPRDPSEIRISISSVSSIPGEPRSCRTNFTPLSCMSSTEPLESSMPFHFLNGVRKPSASSRNLVSLNSAETAPADLATSSVMTTARNALDPIGQHTRNYAPFRQYLVSQTWMLTCCIRREWLSETT